MPRNLAGANDLKTKIQGKAQSGVGYDVLSAYKGGLVPKEFLGLGYESGGNSVFSNVAHNLEQSRRLDNIVNNGVSDEVNLVVSLKDKKVNQPFEMNGKIYRPDKDGNVRITDKGKIDTVMAIKDYQRNVVDQLMGYAMLGDDVCQYMFGLTPTEWGNLTKATNAPKAEYGLSKELNNLDCSIQHIESLPPSLTQTQSIAKLRKIVEYHASSVNIEGITTHNDTKKNIKDGLNSKRINRSKRINIMSGVIQLAVMDVVKSTAGVAVARAVKIEDMLDFGDSFILKNLSNGSLYFAVSDAINAVSGEGSKLLNYNIYGALDDIGFFTASSMIAEKSGTDTQLYEVIQKTLNVSGDTAELITESAIVSGTRFLASYIDTQSAVPAVVKAVRHPVTYVMGMTNF